MTDEPAVKQQLVNAWLAGYFTGFEQGIKRVGWILRNAKEHDCPIPDECADVIVGMGIALEQQAKAEAVREAADIREEENSDG